MDCRCPAHSLVCLGESEGAKISAALLPAMDTTIGQTLLQIIRFQDTWVPGPQTVISDAFATFQVAYLTVPSSLSISASRALA